MSEIYVNEQYPKSNRTSSRPYYPYFNKQRTEQENAQARFLNALYELGFELIGGEDNRCCDMNFSDKVNRDEAFKNKQFIVDNIGDNRLHAFPVADDALINIRIELSKEDDDAIDIAVLKENMEVLWNHRPMLDPRLVHAERIFTNIAERDVENLHSYREGENPKERLAASLKWMADEDNASKIAQMFIYSRLAQHFGETNDFMPLFAHKVHTDLVGSPNEVFDEFDVAFNQSYVAERLKDDPYGYYRSVLPQPTGIVAMFKDLKESLTYNPEEAAKKFVVHSDDLKATAEKLTSDHWKLHSGEWANDKINELNKEKRHDNLKVIKPSVLKLS